MISPRTLMNISRVAIALSLAFWVAGLGCVFGCESLAMTSAEAATGAQHHEALPDATTIVSGDSCASRADHNCCAKHRTASSYRKKTNEVTSTPNTSSSLATSPVIDPGGGMIRQCPMALNATALASKVRTDESTTSIEFQPAALPLVGIGQLAGPSAPAFFNNRGHTYLHCCVFLI